VPGVINITHPQDQSLHPLCLLAVFYLCWRLLISFLIAVAGTADSTFRWSLWCPRFTGIRDRRGQIHEASSRCRGSTSTRKTASNPGSTHHNNSSSSSSSSSSNSSNTIATARRSRSGRGSGGDRSTSYTSKMAITTSERTGIAAGPLKAPTVALRRRRRERRCRECKQGGGISRGNLGAAKKRRQRGWGEREHWLLQEVFSSLSRRPSLRT